MTTPIDNPHAATALKAAAPGNAQIIRRHDELHPPPANKRKKLPGGRRKPLKRLDSDKGIQGNQRGFL
jgi:hypothetical protein